MKNIIGKLFFGKIQPEEKRLENLKELRATTHASGVRVHADLVADILSAKAEIFKNDIKKDSSRYRPRALSISKTIYPLGL